MINKKRIILIISTILIILINSTSYASTDQFKAFVSVEADSSLEMKTASAYAIMTFQKLGYINANGANMAQITNSKSVVLDYISGTGNNYGFFVSAHGNTGVFNMDTSQTDGSQRIYTTDISGHWHLVFINGCYTMSTDAMAQAFKTVGYSNRASLGWSSSIYDIASQEWWGYFYNSAGNMSLRTAALDAASRCTYSTPIRAYGDKENWDGKAW